MHVDQVNQVFFSTGEESQVHISADMLVDSALQVYIRDAQVSGSLFGRVGNLFHSITPIPGCGYCFCRADM